MSQEMTEEEKAVEAELSARLTEGENGETIFKLDVELDFAGKMVTELVFPRLRGKFMRNAKMEEGLDAMLRIAEKMTGYPASFFDELSGGEILAITATVAKLLGKPRSAAGK